MSHTSSADGGKDVSVMIYGQRYDRAAEALRQNGIDAWVILGRETHILGEPALLFLMPADVMNRAAVVVTAQGERICIISPIEAEEAKASGLFTRVQEYPRPALFEDTITQVIKTLVPLNKIALDFSDSDPSSDGLTYTAWMMLQRCFKEAGFSGDLVSAAPVMKLVRGRKSDEEVEKIAAAVTQAMKIYEEARSQMRLGLSGMDVQRLFQGIIDRKGYGYSWQKQANPYVSVGARSSYNCKIPPADVFIEPGDLVNVDLGIRLDGFASDNQRSFYALKAGETCAPYEVQHAWETIQAINTAVCAAMKTSANSDELNATGNRIMLENGYEQGWKSSYGHELGLFAHQGGISAGFHPFKPELDKILEENMTFTLEPAILTSHGRLCQEEVVRVTQSGGQMLSTPQSEIWLIRG